MQINITGITVKVTKKKELKIYSGLIAPELILSMPLELIPSVKLDISLETDIIQELVRTKNYDVIVKMSGQEVTKTNSKKAVFTEAA